MTELDIAQASLDIASWQLWVSATGVIASLVIGLAQCALIWVGLRQMRTASEERNRQLDNQETTAANRHRETMRALEVLIERTGGTGGA